MFRRLICKLDTEDPAKLRLIRGDMLQGVLMEHIGTDYAADLHTQSLQPYSQYLDMRREGAFWVIQTLTDTAGKEIITPLSLADFDAFKIERLKMDIAIAEKRQEEILWEDAVKNFYFASDERIIRMRFLTPTAFKSAGEYVFWPDLKLIFGSLLRKYSVICEEKVADSETLDCMALASRVISYNVRSVYSQIGRVNIPAFCGSVTIKVAAAQSLVNFMNFLVRFGEYAGVGIKCAMGMGAIRIKDRTASESSDESSSGGGIEPDRPDNHNQKGGE